ncbi:MAG TPA: hypothetical protein VGO22_01580 [Pseudorhizobium sp.]|jgi:hypothetical protein|nr:hypothetical protein [Pseudorhizobium sp.]
MIATRASPSQMLAGRVQPVPSVPCRVRDIGAAPERDAAALAALGHSVIAVEPTDVSPSEKMSLHAGRAIEWVN